MFGGLRATAVQLQGHYDATFGELTLAFGNKLVAGRGVEYFHNTIHRAMLSLLSESRGIIALGEQVTSLNRWFHLPISTNHFVIDHRRYPRVARVRAFPAIACLAISVLDSPWQTGVQAGTSSMQG
jgi:hypothetical protein